MQYNLKVIREEQGRSQLEVAMEIGTAQQQLSKWENGKQDITLGKAIKLAELYGVSLDYLAGRTDKKEVNK